MDTPDPDAARSGFIPGPRATMAATGRGALDGLTLAVKDLFDVAGSVTTYGNPDWASSHAPAAATAPAVLALLDCGARLVGKTKTVELAYGLSGENVWHGTPVNPAAPSRFPGGSSCGSASVVASGQADCALGSDTAGSVRIPASYCGLFGIRPSFGAVTLAGARGLAPSFDTCGWFARGARLLAAIGDVLLPGGGDGGGCGPLLLIDEAWVAADPAVAEALRPGLALLERAFGRALDVHIAPEGLGSLYGHMRAVQAQEVWATLGGWVRSAEPRFGPGVGERLAAARNTDPAAAAKGRAFRRMFQARVRPLLAGGAVLAFPTSPCPAPLLSASPEQQEAVRVATIGVTAVASLGGLPEVTLPVGRVAGAPVGLSLVAGFGRDRALLAFATEAAAALGLPA